MDADVCTMPQETNSFTRISYYGNTQFDNYPVIYIDWFQAKTYCEWRGASLPTEAQWEKAARGTDGRTYPWGEDITCNKANYCEEDTTIIGNYADGKSPYGIYDLAGNVWEWVADWYLIDYYKNSPYENPLGPTSGQYRVLRGGAWGSRDVLQQTFFRYKSNPESISINVGFRCARSAP